MKIHHILSPIYSGTQIWWNHGQWRIGNTNDYCYICEADDEDDGEDTEELLPPVKDWRVATEVVSAELCREGQLKPPPTVTR